MEEQPSPGRVAVVLCYTECHDVSAAFDRKVNGHYRLTSFRRMKPTAYRFSPAGENIKRAASSGVV